MASSFTPRLGFVCHEFWAKVLFGVGLAGGIFANEVFETVAALAEGFDVSAIGLSPQCIASTTFHEVVWSTFQLESASTNIVSFLS